MFWSVRLWVASRGWSRCGSGQLLLWLGSSSGRCLWLRWLWALICRLRRFFGWFFFRFFFDCGGNLRPAFRFTVRLHAEIHFLRPLQFGRNAKASKYSSPPRFANSIVRAPVRSCGFATISPYWFVIQAQPLPAIRSPQPVHAGWAFAHTRGRMAFESEIISG